jgi:hypothetical protein
MVWAVALYLWGHPLLAGLATGIGACMKLFALDVVIVLVLYELLALRVGTVRGPGTLTGFRARAPGPGGAAARLVQAGAATAASLIGLLAILDRVAPPYDNAAARFVRGGPISHIGHMISYASGQTGQSGIASYPWQWLIDLKPIDYFTIRSAPRVPGVPYDYPAVHFLGLISPPTLLAGLIGTALVLWRALAARVGPERRLVVLGAAWFLGTFGPFVVAGGVLNRTSYLYYMMIVMPGMYVAGAWLLCLLRRHPLVISAFVAAVVAATALLYPFTPLT